MLKKKCLSLHLSWCHVSLNPSFIQSFTHPLRDQSFPNLSSFLYSKDLISAFLNRFEASISAQAQVFYISPSFRLADRSIRSWGLVLQAVVLARMFALVRLICQSPLFCIDNPYKILDVATQTCIIVYLGCLYSKIRLVHSVFHVIDAKRTVDFIETGINLKREGTVNGYAVSPKLTLPYSELETVHHPAFLPRTCSLLVI